MDTGDAEGTAPCPSASALHIDKWRDWVDIWMPNPPCNEASHATSAQLEPLHQANQKKKCESFSKCGPLCCAQRSPRNSGTIEANLDKGICRTPQRRMPDASIMDQLFPPVETPVETPDSKPICGRELLDSKLNFNSKSLTIYELIDSLKSPCNCKTKDCFEPFRSDWKLSRKLVKLHLDLQACHPLERRQLLYELLKQSWTLELEAERGKWFLFGHQVSRKCWEYLVQTSPCTTTMLTKHAASDFALAPVDLRTSLDEFHHAFLDTSEKGYSNSFMESSHVNRPQVPAWLIATITAIGCLQTIFAVGIRISHWIIFWMVFFA